MIIVTGGSGQLGRAIVERLLERVEPSRLGVSVRDPDKIADLAARGVRVRRADFGDGAALRAAFEGASHVVLVSSNARAFGGDPIAQHRTAIDAAVAAGAQRILYTSHQSASPTSAFSPARDHATTEAMLAAAPIRSVALRNGYYASTVNLLLGDALTTGVLRLPADGPVSWTARADQAEAAAIIAATDDPRHDGPVTLTAAAAVDLAEVVAIPAQLTGRAIERVTITDDDYRAALAARGTPPGLIDVLTSMFVAMRAGEFAQVDPTLAQLLGRPPLAVRDLLASATRT